MDSEEQGWTERTRRDAEEWVDREDQGVGWMQRTWGGRGGLSGHRGSGGHRRSGGRRGTGGYRGLEGLQRPGEDAEGQVYAEGWTQRTGVDREDWGAQRTGVDAEEQADAEDWRGCRGPGRTHRNRGTQRSRGGGDAEDWRDCRGPGGGVDTEDLGGRRGLEGLQRPWEDAEGWLDAED